MSRIPLPLVAVAALGSSATLAAQTGPGLPQLVYDASELFQPVTQIGQPGGGTTNHGHVMLHDGYLAIVRYSPGGVEFYDVANPYAPVLVRSLTSFMDLSEPHTHAQTTAYGGKHALLARGPGGLGGTGFAIWDWTDVTNPIHRVSYDVPGVPGGYATGVFWFFYQAPYVFVGAGSLGLYVVDASDPTAPFVVTNLPTSETGGFNAVNTLAVGNLLVLTNSDGGPGMARLDISDPEDPQLLSSSVETSIPYGLQLSGGRLLVPAVSGPVSSPTGNGGVFEIRDPSQLGFPIVDDYTLPSRGGSVVVQDRFAHVAASTSYVKLDMADETNVTLVGSTPNNYSGGDWDWVTPLGNLAALSDDQGFGTTLVPHELLPDNTGPEVTMVVPADGATDQALTSRVGITLSDMIQLGSIGASSFVVRAVGGAALSGSYSNQFGIVNFTPDAPLVADTTYEVVVPAGGLRDWSGNPTATEFTSTFSTGAAVTSIRPTLQASAPVEPGVQVTFDVGTVSGPGPFQFSWDFGDGSPRTPYSTQSSAAHVYTEAGHYAVLCTVTNGTILGTDSMIQTVHHPLTPERPTRSSTILIDEARGRVWCVNADNDTVTALSTSTHSKELEVPVGAHPRTLAQAPDGTIWVVCQDEATVHVLDPGTGSNQATIALPYASAPYGIAMRPDGGAAYVTLRATGELASLDPVGRTVVGTTPLCPNPKGVAVAADSERIFVTRFLSSSEPSPLSRRTGKAAGLAGGGSSDGPTPTGAQLLSERPRALEPVGEVHEVSASSFTRVRTIPLHLDHGPDTESSGRGLPNYMSSLAVSPDGRRLWVPSKKDNVLRGAFRDGLPLTFDSTVRTTVSQIDLGVNAEVRTARIDYNDRDMAFAIELSPLGDYAFGVLMGSNALDVRDAYTGALVAGVDGTGLAPQGLVLSSDGTTLYVHNFMSRTVAVYDVSGVTSSTSFAMPLLATVNTVASESLSPQVLRGKRIFYNASDPRMNEDGYLSCASCHLDGGHDGRTWDFTDRGEGLRNTVSLVGKGGMAHGRVHWTGNFDEIQDFENDIRASFGGDGFLDDALFNGPAGAPLGAPKQGLSEHLDALAEYVSSLVEFGKSPHREPDGTLTAAGVAGRALFQSLACAQCHSGPNFTDSAAGVRHDVGTIRPSSGLGAGHVLTGFDTPTLRGLWATAPYLHDGSAPTLRDVLTTRNVGEQHGATGSLTEGELAQLEAYLLQIDDLEPAPPSPGP